MSALSVWFLLVFLPNLGKPIAAIIVISGITIVFSLAAKVDVWMQWPCDHGEEQNPANSNWLKEKFADNQAVRTKLLERQKHIKYFIKVGCVGLLAGCLLGAAVPNKKEIAAIVLIPYMSNNAEFQKIPENLAKKLNDYLTDLVPEEGDKNNEK